MEELSRQMLIKLDGMTDKEFAENSFRSGRRIAVASG